MKAKLTKQFYRFPDSDELLPIAEATARRDGELTWRNLTGRVRSVAS